MEIVPAWRILLYWHGGDCHHMKITIALSAARVKLTNLSRVADTLIVGRALSQPCARWGQNAAKVRH